MRIQSQIMAQFSPARIENRGSYLAMAQDRSGQIARTRISMQPGMCFGIVLAGGLSRRMGGGDKALRELGGTSLLARVIAAVRPQCEGLVLSANGDPARLTMFDFPVIADDVQGFKGPLAGILAGLDWMAAHRPDVEFAISVAADTPFLPDDLTARLKDARAKNNAMVLARARAGGRILWPRSGRSRSGGNCAKLSLKRTCARQRIFCTIIAAPPSIGPSSHLILFSMSTNQTISRRRKQFSPGAKPILPKAAS